MGVKLFQWALNGPLVIKIFDSFLFFKFTSMVSNRTLQQNKYYFGVLLPRVSIELYYKTDEYFTKNELHELFKHLYNVRTTRNLSKEKFSEYIESVIDKCINTFHISPIVFNEDLDTYQYQERRRKLLAKIKPENLAIMRDVGVQNMYLSRKIEVDLTPVFV